ncbi:glycosyltransferase family 4 protein [Kineococcus indalonis]|uniref:glycosyltransferase family 4 protein n=1 Tax=Kineococcus indalonis TaxID=2696566 RepID=UPI001412F823|nr:glycosyltransferase family 4 protein [Kineococcus indalonis]NAZ85054.1 glycosyltransferase [Kineococcus indalonis]
MSAPTGTGAPGRPLRVLHLTKRYPDAVGGDAVVVHHLAATQRAAGHEVHVLTSRSPDIVDAPGVHKTGLPLAQEEIDELSLRRVASLAGTALSSFRLLRRLRPDVVHAHTVDLGAALSLAARLRGVPRVLTLHGTSIGDPWFPRPKRALERALVSLAGYRRVLTVDPQALPRLRTRLRPPVEFVPNAVPLAAYPPRDADPAPGAPLLFVGRLEAVKGVDVLLEALAVAAGRGAPADLEVVGGGSLLPALRRQAHELGLGDRVRFLGPLPPARVAERMRAAAGLVLPSRFEGFALVLLEAWASGTPVVTTDVGAVPQVCTDGVDALVVPAGDAEALGAALVRLLTEEGLGARLAEVARREVEEHYTYEALAARVDAVYQEVSPC